MSETETQYCRDCVKTYPEFQKEFFLRMDELSGSGEMKSLQKEFDQQTYMKLEEAQKLEKQLELTKTGFYAQLRKIEDANKILDEIIEYWQDHVLIKKIVTIEDLQRLREVLK